MKKQKIEQAFSKITENDVIKANKDFYDKYAKSYDKIVINEKSHYRLRKSLNHSVGQLSKLKDNITALDACGGTGNASFILYELGCDTHLVDLSKKMNIYDEIPELLSVSLGAAETSLINLASAYGSFVNGGIKINPNLISRIQDRRGRTIFKIQDKVCLGCDKFIDEEFKYPEITNL